MERVYVKVSGDVQGIGFRYSTVEKAKELSLVGWVRNAEDGSVEIAAEGKKENLEKLVEWCRSGPSFFARVEDVEVEWRKAVGEFSSFEVKL